MKRHRISLILISLAIAMILVIARVRTRQQSAEPSLGLEEGRDPVAMEAPDLPQASPTPAGTEPSGMRETQWSEFTEKFGRDLKPVFDSGGKLVSVRGKIGQGTRARPGFDPKEPQAAIARAREVLAEAASMLRLPPESDLAQPIARGSRISAQVFFKQSHEGAEVSPFGTLTVNLGQQGELVGLDSTLLQPLRSENRRTVDRNDARKLVQAIVPGKKIEGARDVFWVPGPLSASGKHAYEFQSNGSRIVVDAESGQVITRSDERQFDRENGR